MSKVVLDITMPLNGFIAGMENETDPLHNWTYGGEAGDVPLLADSDMLPLDDAPKSAKVVITGKRTKRRNNRSPVPTLALRRRAASNHASESDNVYFYYQSKHMSLEVTSANETPGVIHFKFRTLN